MENGMVNELHWMGRKDYQKWCMSHEWVDWVGRRLNIIVAEEKRNDLVIEKERRKIQRVEGEEIREKRKWKGKGVVLGMKEI